MTSKSAVTQQVFNVFVVQTESNCKTIEVQDADGYEIPSDKEFQRYIRDKQQPELIVVFPQVSTEECIPAVPSTSSAGNKNWGETETAVRTTPDSEIQQTTEFLTATEGKHVIVLDKSKVSSCLFYTLGHQMYCTLHN